MYILIIDDNEALQCVLQQLLHEAHYHVQSALTLAHAEEALMNKKYDLILLDWMLSDGSGVVWLEKIRREKFLTPVLLFSSKQEIEDKVEALDRGADDYLCKPFSNIELLARIRALLRRESTQKQTHILLGELHIDLSTYAITYRDVPIKLSKKELELLILLAMNPSVVFTRYQISEHLHRDLDQLGSSNIVDAHIKNLRRKLGNEHLIQTVRGVGYRIAP